MIDWHRDLPPNTEDVFEVIAKALMIRAGGVVIIHQEDLEEAAQANTEIKLDADKSIIFRVERQ